MKNIILITSLLITTHFVKSQTYEIDEVYFISDVLQVKKKELVSLIIKLDFKNSKMEMGTEEGMLPFKVTKILDEYKNKFIAYTEDEGGMSIEVTLLMNSIDIYNLDKENETKRIHRHYRIKKSSN